jgi:hypothetical protein
MIRSKGQGLKLIDYPGITLFNLDPELLNRMKVRPSSDGVLDVQVTTIVPAVCMGSGIGSAHVAKGDYDIVTSDEETVREFGIDRIRFGDIVALMDHDNRFGRAYRKGAVTIGVVVHSDCREAGHGPGVTTVMTCASPLIRPVIDPGANIADIFGIGTRLACKQAKESKKNRNRQRG